MPYTVDDEECKLSELGKYISNQKQRKFDKSAMFIFMQFGSFLKSFSNEENISHKSVLLYSPAMNSTILSAGSSWSILRGWLLTHSSMLCPSSIRWTPRSWYHLPNSLARGPGAATGSAGEMEFLLSPSNFVFSSNKRRSLVLFVARSSRLDLEKIRLLHLFKFTFADVRTWFFSWGDPNVETKTNTLTEYVLYVIFYNYLSRYI